MKDLVLVVCKPDGTPDYVLETADGKPFLVYATHPKSGKSYFQPRTPDQNVGQIFSFGVKVDADVLPFGINTKLALVTSEGVVVPVNGSTGKRGETRLSTETITHDGQEFHVSPGQAAISQQSDGTCNLRLNVVSGPATALTGGTNRQPLAVSRKPFQATV